MTRVFLFSVRGRAPGRGQHAGAAGGDPGSAEGHEHPNDRGRRPDGRPALPCDWHHREGPAGGQSKRMTLLSISVISGSCKNDDYYLSRIGYVLSNCFPLLKTAVQSARHLIEIKPRCSKRRWIMSH